MPGLLEIESYSGTSSTKECNAITPLLEIPFSNIPAKALEEVTFYDNPDLEKFYPQIKSIEVESQSWVEFAISLFQGSRNLTHEEQKAFRKVRIKRGRIRKLDF